MTNSQFCLQQRQQEQRRLNKLLIAGFVSSAAVHGILAYALPKWSFEPQKKAEEPIEMILVDKPKPKPKTKVESKPVQPPEPVQAQTPPPPVEPPEPVRAQTPPPKPVPETPPAPTPAPKKVVTDPTPAPSPPIVSVPIENTGQSSLTSSFTTSSSSVATSSHSGASSIQGKPGASGSAVAINSAPPRPEASDGREEGISCINNCEPEYPDSLEGEEGNAGIKLTIDGNGNVVGAELVEPHSNSGVNRQALLAARQMQFSSPGNSSAAVRVNIDFTVEGSQYDRARQEEQEKKEQAARERQEQEAARQQQLEAERQARQEQLERERQARQQQESAPPTVETKPEPKPLPTLSPEELDEERLRKFKERMEQYQDE
ncbi:MAG: TonB family protein [Cyanobacteria bacterium J06635_13]